jgi:hypothetical protein
MWEVRGGEWKGEGRCTRSNIESMSVGKMVVPSLAMKRKPWVEAADRSCAAVEGVGEERDIMGMVESPMVIGDEGVCKVVGCAWR